MLQITIPIAFVAGLASFFAPCTLPLLPVYVAYIAGESVSSIKNKKNVRRQIISSSLMYVLGFSLVFVILGIGASGLGILFRQHSLLIQIIGGAFILLFGLEFVGFIQFKVPTLNVNHGLQEKMNKVKIARPFLLGALFAVVWTPCVGPVLGSILALAITTTNLSHGAVLLFFYSLGIAIPFLLTSIFISSFEGYYVALKKWTRQVSLLAGILLITLGLLFITDTFNIVFAILSGIAN